MEKHITSLLRFLIRPFYSGIGAVMCLHRVVPNEQRSVLLANQYLEVTPNDLDALIAYIKKQNYKIVTLDEIPAALKTPPRSKFIAFTFDDGYLDNLVYALPAFRAHEAPFAVNITTGLIDRKHLMWWHLLEHLFQVTDRLKYRDTRREYTLELKTIEDQNRAFAQLFQYIRSGTLSDIDSFIQNLFKETALDPLALSSQYLMTWDDIRTLAADPLVTIGAHTIRHPVLSQLTSEELRHELLGSKTTIEAQIGRPVRHFAYPFGDSYAVEQREIMAARNCGFATAATTQSANLFRQHQFRLHSLPRIRCCSRRNIISEFVAMDSGLRPAREHRFRRVV